MDIFYDYIFWIIIFSLIFHLLEENLGNLSKWLNEKLLVSINPLQFYSIQLFWLVLFTLFAIFGWMIPSLSLSGATILLVDALFFHLTLSIRKKTLVPGTISAFFLFLPLFVMAIFSAIKGGVPMKELILSFFIGIAIAFYPFIIFVISKKKQQI